MDSQLTPRARVVALGRRWFVAYLLVYMLPFPLGQIPGVDELMGVLRRPWVSLVGWVGAGLFGVEAVPRHSGSGDTTYHHVELVWVAALAAAIALAWPLLGRGRELSPRVIDRVRAYASIYLGGWLLFYGWSKLIPLQFPEPGPDRLLIPYGDSSPMGLLWTFMGASAPYQMLAGLAEVTCGMLLFWRRSRLLGALLAIGVMGNVVALNYCYDVPVKLFSSHLWVVALFIAAPDLRRLCDLLWFHRGVEPRAIDPYPIVGRGGRRALVGAKLGLVALLSSGAVIEGFTSLGRVDRGSRSALDGVYRVWSFTREGAGAADEAWLRVGLSQQGRAAIVRADGSGQRYRLQVDEEARTLQWTRSGATERFRVRYRWSAHNELELRGVIDGVATTVVLRREYGLRSALLSRGFHWVQEAPFNR